MANSVLFLNVGLFVFPEMGGVGSVICSYFYLWTSWIFFYLTLGLYHVPCNVFHYIYLLDAFDAYMSLPVRVLELFSFTIA